MLQYISIFRMFAGFSASLQSKLSLPCIIFLGYQRLLFGPSVATLQPLPRQKIPQDWLSTSACIMQQLFSGMSPCRLANLIRVRSRILPTRLTTASGVIRHFRPKASSKNDRTVVTKDGRLPQNGGIPSPKEKKIGRFAFQVGLFQVDSQMIPFSVVSTTSRLAILIVASGIEKDPSKLNLVDSEELFMRLSWTIMDDLYDLYDSDTNIYQHHSEVSASTTPAQLFMSPDYLSIKLRTSAPLLPSRSRELPHQIPDLESQAPSAFALASDFPSLVPMIRSLAMQSSTLVTQSPRDELVWVWIFLDFRCNRACRSASSSS